MVGADFARLRSLPERTITGLSVLLQSNALKQALAALHRRRALGPVARRRDGAPRRGRRPGLRDRGPDRRRRRACGALLPVPPHRGSVRRTAHPAHHRRRLARPRRPRLRRAAARMAEDAAEEERLASSSPPSRSPTSTASAIAPAIIESCPTRIFLPNERALEPQIATDLSPLRTQRSADRDPEPVDAQARLLLPVAPRQSPVRARPLRSRARLHRRLLQDRPERHRRDRRRARPRRVRRRVAARARASIGRPTCSPPKLRRFHHDPHRLRAALRRRRRRCSRSRPRAFPPTRNGSSSTRPTTRRTC